MFRLFQHIKQRGLHAGRASLGGEVGQSRNSTSANSSQSAQPAGSARRQALVEANAKREYEVTRDDLPLSCPMPNMTLWNSHPRVYLPIEETGRAMCPYCAAEYFLRPKRAPEATTTERAAREARRDSVS